MDWCRLPTLTGMNATPEIPVQFAADAGIGLSLINAATRRKLTRARDQRRPSGPPGLPTGDVQGDIVAMGTAALNSHVRQLLRRDSISVIAKSPTQVRIRVCGAIDYVIDRRERSVWVEPTPESYRERRAKERPPWPHPWLGRNYQVDILNPLCKPVWLGYVAARPGWFGYALARHEDLQCQLFVDQGSMTQALNEVTAVTWRTLHGDPAMAVLQHQLATLLALHIGPRLIDLAMQSRIETRQSSLIARHLTQVWTNQQAFETMRRENPRLLSALSAWLDDRGANNADRLTDALPLMRQDLIGRGLSPKAWRQLAQHGLQPLLPANTCAVHWREMVATLQSLRAAHWPSLPPPGFLRLLLNTAGTPARYQSHVDEVSGWFWELTCNEASKCRSDTTAYRDLCDQVPKWAWLVREMRLHPDKNQRRSGVAWLRHAAGRQELAVLAETEPKWALWLRDAHWAGLPRLEVVPLLSPGAVLAESFALRNCADSYIAHCMNGSRLLISLRDRTSKKRVALAGLFLRDDSWRLGQVAGPCNQPVPRWIREVAGKAVAVVNHHHRRNCMAPESPSRD